MALDPPPTLILAPGGPASRWRRLWRSPLLWIPVGCGVFYLVLLLGVSQPMPWVRPGPPVAGADPARLERDVRMLAETLRPRDWGHAENLDRVAAWIEVELRSAGGRVLEQPFTVSGRRVRNLCAQFGPAGDPVVVVGAHYDAFGVLPGADDNASGVAGLLELARSLGRRPPPRPVELVAYTLEEPPHFRKGTMGSAVHAASLASRVKPPEAVLCLEMIGCFDDTPGSQAYPLGFGSGWYPGRGNFIAVIGRVADLGLTRRVKAAMVRSGPLPVWSMNAPRWIPGLDFSDHHPYWDRGHRAVMITDSAFYRNRRYHTARDLPETLDYPRMAAVVLGVEAAVHQLTAP